MRKILMACWLAIGGIVPVYGVMPPSTSLELPETENPALQEAKDPRYQIIPVETIIKLDRATGKIWILEITPDRQNHFAKRWVEFKTDAAALDRTGKLK